MLVLVASVAVAGVCKGLVVSVGAGVVKAEGRIGVAASAAEEEEEEEEEVVDNAGEDRVEEW